MVGECARHAWFRVFGLGGTINNSAGGEINNYGDGTIIINYRIEAAGVTAGRRTIPELRRELRAEFLEVAVEKHEFSRKHCTTSS